MPEKRGKNRQNRPILIRSDLKPQAKWPNFGPEDQLKKSKMIKIDQNLPEKTRRRSLNDPPGESRRDQLEGRS